MGFLIEWAAQSDVGRQRDHNEDSYLVDEDEGIWIVADGMGGHLSGEDASQIAVQSIYHYLTELRDDPSIAGRFPSSKAVTPGSMAFESAIHYANERIFVESLKDPAKHGMGTTLVGALREGDYMVLAYVGDSRIYRLRQGRIEQVSVDHSLLNHLLATGKLTPETVGSFTQTNVILRALGLRESVEVDVKLEPLVDGDIYLLCSDGLSDLVDDRVMEQVLRESGEDLTLCCQKLIALANANGGKDNITVILFKAWSEEQQYIVM
ncbi:MAG: Stp1/IreP family PP2C-type Ser/Thr phosphatase [Bradymonadales bacterium]|nr:Stp1/IreP family PP2C-type Ser/Thr phosphatase [Bradymonadales bacterium]